MTTTEEKSTYVPARDVRPGQRVLTNDEWQTVAGHTLTLADPEGGDPERAVLRFADGGVLRPPADLLLIVRDAPQVFPLAGAVGWMVASASLPGAFRHVTFYGSQMRCTCPAGVRMQDTRSPCRHARLVAAYESKATSPRPSMPVSSALVDE